MMGRNRPTFIRRAVASVEFKTAAKSFQFEDLVKYCVALGGT